MNNNMNNYRNLFELTDFSGGNVYKTKKNSLVNDFRKLVSLTPNLTIFQNSDALILFDTATFDPNLNNFYIAEDLTDLNSIVGMTDGDFAYRLDNQIYYSYTGSAWVEYQSGTNNTSGTAETVFTTGDKVDLTISSDQTTYTINENVVTFSKMQDMADNKVLGRLSQGSSGDIMENDVYPEIVYSLNDLVYENQYFENDYFIYRFINGRIRRFKKEYDVQIVSLDTNSKSARPFTIGNGTAGTLQNIVLPETNTIPEYAELIIYNKSDGASFDIVLTGSDTLDGGTSAYTLSVQTGVRIIRQKNTVNYISLPI